MSCTAEQAIALMQSWINSDKKKIIDIYNNHKPLAQGFLVPYTGAWCDTTISALFIALDSVDIIGGTIPPFSSHIPAFLNS